MWCLIFTVISNRFLYLAKEGAIVPPDGSGAEMGVITWSDWLVICIPRYPSFIRNGEDLDGARCVTTLSVDWKLERFNYLLKEKQVSFQKTESTAFMFKEASSCRWTENKTRLLNLLSAFLNEVPSKYLRCNLPYLTKDFLYRRLVNAKMRMKSWIPFTSWRWGIKRTIEILFISELYLKRVLSGGIRYFYVLEKKKHCNWNTALYLLIDL